MCNHKWLTGGKTLLILTLIIAGLMMSAKSSRTHAQDVIALPKSGEVMIYQDAPELAFCGRMVSQVSLFQIKNNESICSKNNTDAIAGEETVRRIKVILTAYSSTAAQTDNTPFITANGTYVHDGVIANNGFPFGTQIRIPELYGDKVFSVEDRMHWRKSNYQFDIWFPTYEQAKNFGVKYAYVEILENNN